MSDSGVRNPQFSLTFPASFRSSAAFPIRDIRPLVETRNLPSEVISNTPPVGAPADRRRAPAPSRSGRALPGFNRFDERSIRFPSGVTRRFDARYAPANSVGAPFFPVPTAAGLSSCALDPAGVPARPPAFSPCRVGVGVPWGGVEAVPPRAAPHTLPSRPSEHLNLLPAARSPPRGRARSGPSKSVSSYAVARFVLREPESEPTLGS